jgi:hypothetical protein
MFAQKTIGKNSTCTLLSQIRLAKKMFEKYFEKT